MTTDGVNGTAADCQPETGRGDHTPGSVFINRDDGLLAPRYIQPAYPNTPAGAAPDRLRCERQVASALRNNIDLLTASSSFGPGGTAGRACIGLRPRGWPAKRLR